MSRKYNTRHLRQPSNYPNKAKPRDKYGEYRDGKQITFDIIKGKKSHK